jgi:hypothetical protein
MYWPRRLRENDPSLGGCLQDVAKDVMREHTIVKVVGEGVDVARSEEVEAPVRRIINDRCRLDYFASLALSPMR